MATVQETVGTLENTVFNGTFKRTDEIEYFIENNGGHISIDNRYEIEMIDKAASSINKKQLVIMRINLDVGAETHPMVLTSGYDQQFGISIGFAEEALNQIASSKSLLFSGIHVHVGSQIKDPKRYKLAMTSCADFMNTHSEKVEGEAVFNAGGGFFSPYAGDEVDHELSFYSQAIHEGVKEHWSQAYKVMIEPGRALVNNPGVILYTAGAIKSDRGEKPYILVDGGMSDNPRPALYGSEHKLFNISGGKSEKEAVHAVSGRHCESGDLLVKDAMLPEDTESGDILMSTSTGAYTFAMASNYNMQVRPAIVMVKDNIPRLIRRRETYEDLLATNLDVD